MPGMQTPAVRDGAQARRESYPCRASGARRRLPLKWLRAVAAAPVLAAAALLAAPWPAAAEALRWQHAHVFDRFEDGGYVRRGVAMFRFATGVEPATLELRGRMTGAQPDGWHGMRIKLRYRFDDGATLIASAQGRLQRSPDGTVTGAQEAAGSFTGGSGRFAGATGTFTLKGVGGLSGLQVGVLADVFAELTGDLQRPAGR